MAYCNCDYKEVGEMVIKAKRGKAVTTAMVLTGTLALAGCGGAGASSAGGGEDEVTIRFGYFLSDSHPTVEHGIMPFVEEVEEASGGSINFELYPDAQLAPGEAAFESLNTGILDMSTAYGAHLQEELPLNQVWSLPLEMSAHQYANAIWRTLHGENPLAQEFENSNVLPVMTFVSPLYEFSTGSKPVEGIDDLQGLRFRSPSNVYNDLLASVGVNPTEIASTETFEALDRGTVDGTIYNFAAWESGSLNEVLHHSTDGVPVGTGGLSSVVISQSMWDRLSEEQRNIIKEAGREASMGLMDYSVESNTEAKEKFVKEGSLKVYEWSQEDLDEFKTHIDSAVESWVSKAGSAGLDGTAALETARTAGEEAEAEGVENMPSYQE
jgi:TRAP-type transport system periplasmic protein